MFRAFLTGAAILLSACGHIPSKVDANTTAASLQQNNEGAAVIGFETLGLVGLCGLHIGHEETGSGRYLSFGRVRGKRHEVTGPFYRTFELPAGEWNLGSVECGNNILRKQVGEHDALLGSVEVFGPIAAFTVPAGQVAYVGNVVALGDSSKRNSDGAIFIRDRADGARSSLANTNPGLAAGMTISLMELTTTAPATPDATN